MHGIRGVACILFLGLAAFTQAQQANDAAEEKRAQTQARIKASAQTATAERETQVQALKSPETKPKIDKPADVPTDDKREPKPTAEAQTEPKPTVAQNTEAEAENSKPSVTQQAAEPQPRLTPSKLRVDRSGSFIGSNTIPPMPQLTFNTPPSNMANKHSGETDADYEPGELLLSSPDMNAAITAAGQLRASGLTVKSRQHLSKLGLVLTRFRLPAHIQTRMALSQIRQQFPTLRVDTNQRYRLQANSRKAWANTMVNWPAGGSPCLLQNKPVLGMLDTAVNLEHPALKGKSIKAQSFVEGKPADATHATAIASLLLADGNTGFTGLLPQATLYAANVFHLRDESTETNTSALLPALEWLATNNVAVINLSFGGQQNRIFSQAISNLSEQGIAMVAAAGNNGPEAAPVYPAAQREVIAVSAIDAAGHVYSSANQGDYIDFVAPGVNVWAAAGEQGGRYHSGTSFAVPFVTARLALANTTLQTLIGAAEDKGIEGRDKVHGWGLIKGPPQCQADGI